MVSREESGHTVFSLDLAANAPHTLLRGLEED